MMRFCVDYRKVNSITRKDAYPLPRIDATLDTLAGSQWFSTLDLLSGYWQVEVEETDREKTAFCTTGSLFQFRVMAFGLCNAPTTFQRLMDLVLAGLQWSRCLVYIDDVIIVGNSFQEYLRNLQEVLQRLREAGLKPSKCIFFQSSVKYLGYVSREEVMADPDKVRKVATWPVPTSTMETQSFLGFASYYRRFIRDFAEIAKPLHRLTEKTAPFNWTVECQAAFQELRRLTSAPILAHPDFSQQFILDTDASDIGMGAVLSQVDREGRERAIAYGSRLLSKAERQYCVTRRELLAVVTFTWHFRPYLVGQRFLLRTDHGSLTWLQNFREPEGQLARWLEQLQELDFEIVHRKGRKHTNADALSRRPCQQCGRDSHFPPIPASQISVTTVKVSQIPGVLSILDGKCVSRSNRRLLQIWDQLRICDGVLCRQFEATDGRSAVVQVLVPRRLREQVLTDLHEGSLGGHLGVEKTLARVQEHFYWPGYHDDVRNWCRCCAPCATRKNPAPKSRAPLSSVKTGYPVQIVAMDILGPLPESEAGNSYILVVADYFTRWTEAYAIPNQEAITVAKKTH